MTMPWAGADPGDGAGHLWNQDTGQTITVGQVEETDAAGTVTPVSPNVVIIGQATEVDEAWPFTVELGALSVPLAEVAEAQAAQALAVVLGGLSIPLGQTSETDTAGALTAFVPQIVALGQAAETDETQPLTVLLGGLFVALGQATETDEAQILTADNPQIVAFGQASETDTAGTLVPPGVITLGRATESDEAQPLTAILGNLDVALGQATEADEAQSLTADNPTTVALEQVSETDEAQSLTADNPQTVALGQAAETDAAQTITADRTAYSAEVLADSPLLYWRLGESSGTTAVDASGNGRDGTYNGSPTLGAAGLLTGTANTAVSFDGTDDHVAYATGIGSITAFTVEAWVTTTTANRMIASQHESSVSARRFKLQLNSFGRVRAGVSNFAGTETLIESGSAIHDGNRHHVLLTYDSAVEQNNVKLYLDGTLAVQGSRTGSATSTSIPLYVGKYALASQFWSGVIDEFAFYDTVLSATRVTAHYEAGTNTRTVALGQATETDSAGTITLPEPQTIALGQATETDTADTITPSGGIQFVALGQATEVDAAGTIMAVGFPQSIALGQAAETDTARFIAVESDAILIVPEFQLTILDPALYRAPTSLTVLLAGGLPDTDVDFYIDGVLVYSTVLDTDGGYGPASISVDPTPGGAAGTHTLEARQTTAEGTVIVASDTYSLVRDPALYPISANADAQAVDIPETISHDTRHWVLQDLLGEAEGGIGSYILPMNPKEMTSPHLEKALVGRHTTSHDGQFHVFEAGQVPKDWEFSGFCPDEEMRQKIMQYRNLNRRFYVIDHRNRAWKVVFVAAEFSEQLRKNFNGVEVDGYEYRVQAVVLDQQWVTPA